MSAQNAFPSPASADGYQRIAGSCSESDTIRLANGNFIKLVTLTNVRTVGFPLLFRLTYNSKSSTSVFSPVGNKWRHNYMANLTFSGSPTITLVTYLDPSGRAYNFVPSGADWVPDTTSYYFPGTLVQNASNWQLTFPEGSVYTFDTSGNLLSMTDNWQNTTTFHYVSGQLVSVTEPTGRAIQFGYTGSFLTTITDPNQNQTTLFYDTVNNNLTKIMGPSGCTTQYGYTTPSNSLITSRTDPNSNVYSYGYDSSQRLTSVTDAESPSHTISYAYDTVTEYIGDSPVTTQSFNRTTLTDAFSKTWEYRFDLAGNLWRAIQPVNVTGGAGDVYHWHRFFWDDNQKLLYKTSGFPLVNNYSGTGDMAGPRDNVNNRFTRFTTDPTLAVPTHRVDASGAVTHSTYNSARKPTSVYPNQAHFGVQGNWVGQYGADGYVLCAFSSSSADVQSLPGYVSSVSMGTATRVHQDDDSWYHHLMDPRTAVHPTSLRKGNGYWQSSSAFTITVNLSSSQSFNLSVYTNSTDQEYAFNNPVQYNEQMGREVTFSVTDMTGTQTYQVQNNAVGAWVTFPVQGDGSHSITIAVSPSGANSSDARISALMFDPLDSRKVVYGYDQANNQISVTDPLGNTSSAFYNPDGTMQLGTNAAGESMRYFYEDAYRNLTRVRDPLGNDTVMAYDANGNVLSRTDANGHTWSYTYDGKNRLLTTTDPLGNMSQTGYDSAGNVTSTTDANGNVTQFQYTPTNRLKKVTDAASQVTQYAYDAAGNLYTVTDPNTNVTTNYYDNSNRLIRVVRADSTEVQYSYDSLGRMVAVSTPNANQSTLSDINLTGAANLLLNPGLENVNPTNSGAAVGWWNYGAGTLQTGFGHSGNNSALLQTSTTAYAQYFHQDRIPLPSGARALGTLWANPNGSTDSIDVQGSVLVRQHDGSTSEVLSSTMTLPTSSGSWQQLPLWRIDMPGDGQYASFPADSFRAYGTSATNSPYVFFDDFALYSLSTTMDYDDMGRLYGTRLPDGTYTEKRYDRFGRVTALVDAKGNQTTMAYDSLGRVTSVTDALGNVTSYTYDSLGSLLTVTDPRSNVTRYVYDAMRRLTTITYPDGTTEGFVYDAAGNRTRYTNNRGQQFTFVYDAANRLVKRVYGTDSTFVAYGYDAVGNLTSRIERNGDICWYNYDVVNRLVGVERTASSGFSSSGSWLQRHVYDANGNRIEFDNGTSATGGVYGTAVYGTATANTPPLQWKAPTGGYDSMNRLTAYQDEGSNQTSFSYDVEGRVTGITYPNGSPQVAGTAAYDIVGRLLSSDTAQGSTDILPMAYGYDENGNRVGVTTGTDSYDYTVDATNRLVQEDINRFVERNFERFKLGTPDGVDVASGAVTLLALADSFTGNVLNVERWQQHLTNVFNDGTVANGGFELRQQGNALLMTFPRGYCNVVNDYGSGSLVTPPTPTFGLANSQVWRGLQHRVPLTGDFDLQVDFVDFQGRPSGSSAWASLILMATNTSMSDVLDNGGNSWIQMQVDSQPEYSSQVANNGTITSNTTATTDTSGKLRIERTGTTVNTYYYSGGAWTTLGTVTGYVTDTMYVGIALVVNGFGASSCANFQSNLSALAYNGSGTYTSAVYDAGRSVTWDTITWSATTPTGTAVEFQVATSSSPDGPFTYVGPDGTSGTYFTTSGTAIYTGTTGRYASYQATLTGNGTNTPTLSRVDLLFGGTNTSTATAYTYDEAGNMTVKVTETPTSSGTTVTETRDSSGWSAGDRINNLNQIMRNDINTVVTSPSSNTTVTWRYTYDSNGCMKTKTDGTNLTTYNWDEDNRLTSVQLPGGSTVSYTYDVMGRMITRTDSLGTTSFVWSGMNCVQETDHAGNITRYYIGHGITSFKRGTSTYQIVSDAIGAIRKVTDASGAVVATYDYDAWGNLLASTSDPLNFPYRWVGAFGVRWDAATGLYYMRQRWYDPQIGRFISRDRGQGYNRYNYVNNAPTVAIDPAGKYLKVVKNALTQLLLTQYSTLTGLSLSIGADNIVSVNDYKAGPVLSSSARNLLLQVIADKIYSVLVVPNYTTYGDQFKGAGGTPNQSDTAVNPCIEGAGNSLGSIFGYSWLMHSLGEAYALASKGNVSDGDATFLQAHDNTINGIENSVLQDLGSLFGPHLMRNSSGNQGMNYTDLDTGQVFYVHFDYVKGTQSISYEP